MKRLIIILPGALALALAQTGCESQSGHVTNAESAPAMMSVVADAERELNTEAYDEIVENTFRSPRVAPLSTFSIDADTASYANLRRFLTSGQRPPPDAVRIEELINYFPYDYAPPPAVPERAEALVPSEHPFAVYTEVGPAPWQPGHQLLRIGLKGYEVAPEAMPPANLVFLLDTSGSMGSDNKLPLVIDSMKLLARQLDADDRVAIVVYAGSAGLALPSTPANNIKKIKQALGNLRASGSTNGGEGIQLAYKVARENFIEGGVNRVVLCTDGDFNVGMTNRGELVDYVAKQAEADVYLTVLGFGMGNLKDGRMETFSNKGNGNYAYIDSMKEARKVFLRQLTSNLLTIAKDVKIQVEFNPAKVKAYRLIGYENRMLKSEDFNDDKKDAGEIGAGHTVTALYEIAPPESLIDVPGTDELKYQVADLNDYAPNELATVKLRYKWPDEDESRLLTQVIAPAGGELASLPADFRFAAAVAAFGMVVRGSSFRGDADLDMVTVLARNALGEDPGGYRKEFLKLIAKARKVDLALNDTELVPLVVEIPPAILCYSVFRGEIDNLEPRDTPDGAIRVVVR